MQKNSYQILNVSENATNEEIVASYTALKEKYQEERFLDGEEGNYAAKMLSEIDTAYDEIMTIRNEKHSEQNTSNAFIDVENAIKAGDMHLAQEKLDSLNDRGAEWHYLQSVIFYRKNWTNESKKQLELAMRLEPSNVKYKEAYNKLDAKIKFNNQEFNSGNAQNKQQTPGGDMDGRQMGGDACGDAGNCCSTFLCMNCLYNCCCGCR